MAYNLIMADLNKISGFNIFGFEIKFYGIIISLAMLLGVIIACKIGKKRNLTSENIVTLALYVLPIAVLCARLYYVIFSSNSYTFLEFFEIWNGGLAIYGGVIGGAIGVGLFCLFNKKNFFDVADIVVIVLILGQALGRWGNFFNQEAFGYEVTSTSWQWFPFAVFIESTGTWHLATFFYESLCNIIIFTILLITYKKTNTTGLTTCLYFILYGICRLFIEGLRTDSLYIGNSGIRVSQLLSGIMIIVSIGVLICIYINKSRKSKNNK